MSPPPVQQRAPAPGLATLPLPVARPERLSDLAAREMAGARGAWALLVNGDFVRPADFPHVTVFPASEVTAVFRAEGDRGFASAAIMAAALFAYAAGAPPIAVAIGAAAANMLANALIPPPKVPQPVRKLDDSQNNAPTLSSAQNSGRIGDPIPEIFGKRLVVPDLCGAPYTENTAGDVQKLYQIMSIGMGSYDLHEVRLGSAVVWQGGSPTTSAVGVEYVEPGATSAIFPHRVVPADTGRVELKWVDAATFSGPVVIGQPGQRVDRIALDVEFEGGLANYTGGGFTDHSVDLRFEYRAINDAGNPLTPWMRLADETVTRVTRSPVRVTVEADVLPRRYEVRGQYSSAQASSQYIVNQSRWTGARGFVVDGDAAVDYARLAIRIENTAEFASNSALQTKVLVTRKLPEWTGSAWSAVTATRKRAAAVSHLLRNANCGGLPDAAFDVGGLWALQTDWTAEGDTFDAIVDVRTDLLQHVRAALAVGLADVTPFAGVLTFTRDVARSGRTQFFGPANVLRDSVAFDARLPGGDDYTHTEVEYPDAELDYQRVRVKCATDGVTFGDKPRVVSASDCTDRTLAWRYGMYIEAVNAYRRLSGRLAAEMQGRLVLRGARIELAHPLLTDAAPAGIVLSYDAGTRAFTLSEDFGWSGGPHYLLLRDLAGKGWGPLLVTAGAADNIAIADASALTALETATGLLVADVLAADGQFTPFAIGEAADVATGFLVEQVTPGAGGQSYAARLVIDDPRVYTVTSGLTPPPRATVLPVPGTPAAAPDVERFELMVPGAGYLSVEIQIPAGATAYQATLDGGAAVDSDEPTILFSGVTAGAHTVAVRAFGTAWGAWISRAVTLSATVAVPGAAGSYAVSGTPDPAAPAVAWTAATDATQYLLRVLVAAVEVGRFEGNIGLAQSWTSGQIAAMGGPWAGVTVALTPQNIVGNAAEQFLLIGQPGFLTGVAVTAVTFESFDVDMDDAVEGTLGYATIGGYVIAIDTTTGFDPESPAESYGSATSSFAVGGRAETTTYYFRVAAWVGSASGLNWSAEMSVTTTASP